MNHPLLQRGSSASSVLSRIKNVSPLKGSNPNKSFNSLTSPNSSFTLGSRARSASTTRSTSSRRAAFLPMLEEEEIRQIVMKPVDDVEALRWRPRCNSPVVEQSLKQLDEVRLASLKTRNYETAQDALARKLYEKQVQEQIEIENELMRQDNEWKKFNDAFEVMHKQFEEEWERKMKKIEDECNEKLLHLQEKHEMERKNLEEVIGKKIMRIPLRYSCKVNELQHAEKALAKNNLYDESKILRDRLRELEAQEQAQQEQMKKKLADQRWQRLNKKQEEEMKFLLAHIANIKNKALQERKTAEQQLRQRKKNLEEDMRHEHHMEFIKNREVVVPSARSSDGISRPSLSRRSSSSTFRGTQLSNRVQPPSKMMPSLCLLEDL